MTDLDDRLARALDEAVPQPPCALDPESMRTTPAGRPRRRALGPALVAAAIVVVAAGVGIVGHHRSAPSSAPNPSTGPTGHPPPPRGVADPKRITARVVARLLAAAPTLPGATPVDQPPVKALRTPMEGPGTQNLVQRTRWWTGPGTVADALAFYGAHPPAGMSPSGSSTAGGPNRATVEGLFWDPTGRQWRRPGTYVELELQVSVTALHSGVALRVDAEAVWVPLRTAGEQIPVDVMSVDVVRSDGGATVRRTLDAAAAGNLGRVVNGLPVLPPMTLHGCPQRVGSRDRLTFHGPHGEVEVNASTSGCGYVEVGSRDEHNPGLGDAQTLDNAVVGALGLPRN